MNKKASNNDSLIKSVGTILLGLIVFSLVYNVFFGPSPAHGLGMAGSTGGMHGAGGGMGTGFGISLGSILAGILTILIELLSLLLIVGLVLGLWVVVKDYVLNDGENPFASLTGSFNKPKMNCPKCGSSVNTRWDFCPDCGQPLTKENKPAAENTQLSQG